jgi:hypothetical protein
MKGIEITETEELARKLYAEGKSFVDMLEKSLSKPSKFTDGLLYSISMVSFEKLMVGLLAYYDVMATHHTPLALFKEAQDIDKGLTDEMKETPKLLNKFESICSLDGFGQRTPSKEELNEIIIGLKKIQVFVEDRIFN